MISGNRLGHSRRLYRLGCLLQLDSQAKAIVSSGYSNDPVMADFQSFGFRGADCKPFRFEDLCRVVDDILS